MPSTHAKRRARDLMKANPGMKYTEALRHAAQADLTKHGTGRWSHPDLNRASPQALISTGLRSFGNGSEDQPLRASEILRLAALPDSGVTAVPLANGAHLITQQNTGTSHVVSAKSGNNAITQAFFDKARSTPPKDSGDLMLGASSGSAMQNVGVFGHTGAGASSVMRQMAKRALSMDMEVVVFDALPGYSAITEGPLGHDVYLASDFAGGYDPATAYPLLMRIEPGSVETPLLVIFDSFPVFAEAWAKMGEGWVKKIEDLMRDPRTIVVINAHQSSRVNIPHPIMARAAFRVLLGRSDEEGYLSTFRDLVPEATLESFDRDNPTWQGATPGRGIYWDGRHLTNFHSRTSE